MKSIRLLAVVGSNPAKTSGVRTVNRARKAACLLGFDRFVIGNLLDIPTYRTGNISEVAAEYTYWSSARINLIDTLSGASGVLLAYGIDKPTGLARNHFVNQVSWLSKEIKERRLPVWAVGGRPYHPSRWQRYTHRSHPGIDFEAALALSLIRIDSQP